MVLLQGLFDMLDLDGNGYITIEEVEQIHKSSESGLFEALDLNHDEMVTTAELQTFMGTLKAHHGASVLDLIFKYLVKNATACREGRPTAVHPIEALFLSAWESASVAAVASPNASLDNETRSCLTGLYNDVAANGPVTAESVRAVHGAHADDLVSGSRSTRDDAPIGQSEWLERANQLVKRSGLNYVSSLANCMKSNVTKQEACKLAIESM